VSAKGDAALNAWDAEQGAAVDGPSVAEVLAESVFDAMEALGIEDATMTDALTAARADADEARQDAAFTREAHGPSVADIAEAIWDALDTKHDTAWHVHAAECCWSFPGAMDAIAAEVSRQVAAREAEAVEAALDKVERRLRALKRVGDAATHETVIQVALTIVREVRRPAPAEVAEVPGLAAVLADHRWSDARVGCLCRWDPDYHGGHRANWHTQHEAHVAAAVLRWLTEAVKQPGLVEAVAKVETAQLVCYTLPANYAAPLGDQSHEDVARRCGPIHAERMLAALPEALTQTAAPDLGPESNDSHAWLGSDR
jgi:hypothetical protein